MVSMYLDIRQAAELLAQVTHRHPIEISQMINHAGQRHGLTFCGPLQNTIEWSPNFFWIDEDATGKRFIQPAGYIKNGDGQTISRVRPGKNTSPSGDGNFVADVHVSIADIACNPHFKFNEEVQRKILDVHQKMYAPAPAPAPDDKLATAPQLPGNATEKKWTDEKLAEVKAYREKHGTKKTAAHYQVSVQLIRRKLPSANPESEGYSAFTHHVKR